MRDLFVRYRQLGKRNKVAVQPLAVRLTPGVVLLALLVGYHGFADGIHKQHLPGAEAILADDIPGGNIQNSHL